MGSFGTICDPNTNHLEHPEWNKVLLPVDYLIIMYI